MKGAFRAAKRRFLLQTRAEIVRVFVHVQIISQFRTHLNTRISKRDAERENARIRLFAQAGDARAV
jgi:hypothetical protein